MIIPPLPLDQYPPHIVQAIAACSAQEEIRSLMATSQAFRRIAEVYRKEKRITADPVLVPSVYKAIDSNLVKNLRKRLDDLKAASALLTSHLSTHPLSSSNVRQLIVEVRDDDSVSGWEHVQRLADQLEKLEFHVVDQSRRPALQHCGDDECQSCVELDEDEPDSAKLFEPISETTFSKVTSLTLASTAFIHKHLQALAPKLPKLRELILSCHWTPVDVEWDTETNHCDFVSTCYRMLAHELERLTIVGDKYIATKLLSELAFSLHRIRYLTISMPCKGSWGWNDFYLEEAVNAILGLGHGLQGFAIYGPDVHEILQSLHSAMRGPARPGRKGLKSVISLVLEQTDIDTAGNPLYPLLDVGVLLRNTCIIADCPDLGFHSSRIALPNLDSLTFVLDQRDTSSADSEICYDLNDLRALFAHYPTLQAVSWVSAYPTLNIYDYQSNDPTTNPNLLCLVVREENDEDQSDIYNVGLIENNYSIPQEGDTDGEAEDGGSGEE